MNFHPRHSAEVLFLSFICKLGRNPPWGWRFYRRLSQLELNFRRINWSVLRGFPLRTQMINNAPSSSSLLACLPGSRLSPQVVVVDLVVVGMVPGSIWIHSPKDGNAIQLPRSLKID